MPKFDDQTIETLFGADDAEHERPERFKEYFFYNGAYNSVVSNLSIRVLVGHKGVGKSALLKRAFLADIEANKTAFWLQSGDIDSIKPQVPIARTLVGRIEAWKRGISAYLASNLLKLAYPESYSSVSEEIRAGSTQSLRDVYDRALTLLAKQRGVPPSAMTVKAEYSGTTLSGFRRVKADKQIFCLYRVRSWFQPHGNSCSDNICRSNKVVSRELELKQRRQK